MRTIQYKRLTIPMRRANQRGVALSLVHVVSLSPGYPHLRLLPESVIHL